MRSTGVPVRSTALGNGRVRIELAYADAVREILMGLEVRSGATVLECVESSGFFRLVPDLLDGEVGFAVFGRRVEPTDSVSTGDRIEVLRPLELDPKEARRLRARRAGSRRPVADRGCSDLRR